MTQIYSRLFNKMPNALFLRQDVIFGAMMLLIVLMFVVPLPPFVLDGLLSINLFVALVMLLSTIYLKSVLDLSTFPALLLLSTVFRLAVTISTTRGILGHADAGKIVRGFGEFVVAGNLVVGLVVFLIVSIVQFLVVTKGAERIAEVTARFTLDSLPGKQMSIDAEIRSGDLTSEQARKRRFSLERESQFFGSMDGAMRFVKGDAIASLVVVFINLVGGLLIGVFDKGMSLSVSVRTYSILSIGDGLVAQIPAMFSAIASGMLVTRIVSEDRLGIGDEIGRQLTAEKNALLVAAGGLFIIGWLPGFPTSLLSLFAAAVTAAVVIGQRRKSSPAEPAATPPPGPAATLPKAGFADPFVARVNPEDVPALISMKLVAKIEDLTGHRASHLGVALPVVGFRPSDAVAPGEISLECEGVPCAKVELGDGDPATADRIAGQLVGAVCAHFPRIFSIDDTSQWLDSMKPRYARLVAETVQNVPTDLLTQVLRNLLEERVSLAHPRALLELLARTRKQDITQATLTDQARFALKDQILHHLTAGGLRLGVVTLADAMIDRLRILFRGAASVNQFETLEAERKAIAHRIAKAAEGFGDDFRPIVATPSELRLPLRLLLRQNGFDLDVLALPELDHARDIADRRLIAFESSRQIEGALS